MIRGLQYGLYKLLQVTPLMANRVFATSDKSIKLTFHIQQTNAKKTVDAKVGQTLLEVVRKYDLAVEGACEGNCACGTCHVLLEEKVASELPKPSGDEEDLLSADKRRKPNSRLGCQVKVAEHMNGTTITVPV
jgi:ferredoxin